FRLAGMVAAGVIDVAATLGDAPPDVEPALGDHHAVPGLRWGTERGAARLMAGVDVVRPLELAADLRARFRVGTAPRAWDDLVDAGNWVAGAALAGIWSSPLGAIQIGFEASTRGTH